MASTRKKVNGVWRTVDDRTGRPVWDSQLDGTKLWGSGTTAEKIAKNQFMTPEDSVQRQARTNLDVLSRAGAESRSTTVRPGETGVSAMARSITGKAISQFASRQGSGSTPESITQGLSQTAASTIRKLPQQRPQLSASDRDSAVLQTGMNFIKAADQIDKASSQNPVTRQGTPSGSTSAVDSMADSVVSQITKDIQRDAEAKVQSDKEKGIGPVAETQRIMNNTETMLSRVDAYQGTPSFQQAMKDYNEAIDAQERSFAESHEASNNKLAEVQSFIDDVDKILASRADAKGGSSRVTSHEPSSPRSASTNTPPVSLIHVPSGAVELQSLGYAAPGEPAAPGAIVVGGEVMRQAPVMTNRLTDLSPRARSAYNDIQAEFARKNGRIMDREVAGIYALVASGEASTEDAGLLAQELRYDRDIHLSRQLAEAYGGSPQDYYVPTARSTAELVRSIKDQDELGMSFLKALNASENDMTLARTRPTVREQKKRRNLFIAHRYNLAPERQHAGARMRHQWVPASHPNADPTFKRLSAADKDLDHLISTFNG